MTLSRTKLHHGLLLLAGVHLLCRAMLASSLDLGVDEAYYTLYAQYLDWGYFDHPPMVGYLISLTTLDLQWTHEFFVRFFPLVVGALNLYLIFRLGKKVGGKQCALWAYLLYLSSFYGSVISGMFILPDTPLTLFWLLSLHAFIDYLRTNKVSFLYGFGLWVGMGMLSKYQAIFLWIAALLFFVRFNRKAFLKGHLYLSGLISLLLFLPVVLWNMFSPYSGLNYHEGRLYKVQDGLFWEHGFLNIALEAVYQNPFNFFALFLGVLVIFRTTWSRQKTIYFLMASGLPLLGVVWVISFLSTESLPHWSGVAYISLFLVAAYVLVRARNTKKFGRQVAFAKKWIVAGVAFSILAFVGAVFLEFGVKKYGYFTKGNQEERRMNEGNFLVDMNVWQAVNETLKGYFEQQGVAHPVLWTDGWVAASRLNYYVARPLHLPLLVSGSAHHFQRSNHALLQRQPLGEMYYVETSHFPNAVPKKWASYTSSPVSLPVHMNGQTWIYLYLYKVLDPQPIYTAFLP